MTEPADSAQPDANAEPAGLELVLAITRQHLFTISGIASPIPYEILENINDSPVFCTEHSIEESVDLAAIKTVTLVTNSQQQIAVNTSSDRPDDSIPVSITETGLPILAAIRQRVGSSLGLPTDGPRKPTIVALLHQPSIVHLSKAAVIIYHMRLEDPPVNHQWRERDQVPDNIQPYLPALDHLP